MQKKYWTIMTGLAALCGTAMSGTAAAGQGGKDISWRDDLPGEARAINGFGNNPGNPTMGMAETSFLRLTDPSYWDGSWMPSGLDRPGAREISNTVNDQTEDIPNAKGASDFLWQWGQFLDHDINETPVILPKEPFDIEIPQGDPFFDPFGTGEAVMPLNRSFYEMRNNVRQQVNAITSCIDASNVYGSGTERQEALRRLDGSGKLKTSAGNMLPYNVNGLPNAGGSDPSMFIAGDVRSNEQAALTVMHTLFVREHNYWADRIARESRVQAQRSHGAHRVICKNPRLHLLLLWLGLGRYLNCDIVEDLPEIEPLTGDEIYEMARCIVAAEMQVITYREFLPVLLGEGAVGDYHGYDPTVSPAISNEFATCAFRVGHTMLSPTLLRLDWRGRAIPEGNIALANAFFNPNAVLDIGLEPYLRGLAGQICQEIDPYVIDDVRNMLFGPPGAGGFDLPSLNIQRGRDHGLPSYNDLRRRLGLEAVADFEDIGSDPEVQDRLAAAYGDVELIDPWVGGLCEDHVPGAMVGETFFVILGEQFQALRDGDRFWYQRYLSPKLVKLVESQSLADVIRRNTLIGYEIQEDVFRVGRRHGWQGATRGSVSQSPPDHPER